MSVKNPYNSVQKLYDQLIAAGWRHKKMDRPVTYCEFDGELVSAFLEKRYGKNVWILLTPDGLSFPQASKLEEFELDDVSVRLVDTVAREVGALMRAPKKPKVVPNALMDAAVYHVLASMDDSPIGPYISVNDINESGFYVLGPYYRSGITKSSIRQSLQRLARKGLVHRSDGKGNLGIFSDTPRLNYWITYHNLIRDPRFSDDFGDPNNVPPPKVSPPSPPEAWNPIYEYEGQVPRIFLRGNY